MFTKSQSGISETNHEDPCRLSDGEIFLRLTNVLGVWYSMKIIPYRKKRSL